MNCNEKTCPLSSSLTFSLVSDWPEKCGKPLAAAFSRFSLLPPPRQLRTFLLKKIHLGEKASSHLIVKTEKNTKTQVTRVFKEESHDIAIFDLAFNIT